VEVVVVVVLVGGGGEQLQQIQNTNVTFKQFSLYQFLA
jgi:hypothetical protein